MNRTTRMHLLWWVGGEAPRQGLVAAQCKTGFAAARKGMMVYRVDQLVAVRDGGRIRFGARWVCGSGTPDAVILVADPDQYGEPCQTCTARWFDVQMGLIAVYRCFDGDGLLLYVGSTGKGVSTRTDAHARTADWWPSVAVTRVQAFDNLLAARAAELRAIRTEHPLHNVQGRRRRAAS